MCAYMYIDLKQLQPWLESVRLVVSEIPYSLKYSRIKYFAVWLQKQIFTDKIFVVERESSIYVYKKY